MVFEWGAEQVLRLYWLDKFTQPPSNLVEMVVDWREACAPVRRFC